MIWNKRESLGCGLLSLFSVTALCFIIVLITPPRVDQLKLDTDKAATVWPTPIKVVTPSPDDQIWIIPGDLGTTHHLTGTLEVNVEGTATRIFMQVSRLRPGSPSSGSRSIAMKVNCTQPAGITVQWHFETLGSDSIRSRSEDYVCGDSTSTTFSYDYNYRWLVFDTALGAVEDITYSLTATVHSPY